ncbi:MAG: aldose 1-epimerase family protein [Cetobacterium sp.]
MYKLENDKLIVEVNEIGGELKRVFSKEKEIEYIWHGKTGSFLKSAPNLFPFIGNIKNGEIDYPYDGKRITLPMDKHGFVREALFQVIEKNDTKIVFQLKSSEELKNKYPYEFIFKIEYILEDNNLIQKYIVENEDKCEMYYHVGGHTAFSCKYRDRDTFEDFYLEFNDEKCIEYNMDKGGQFVSSEKIELELEKPFKLYKKRFKEHAYVLDELKNKKISLKNKNSNHGIELEFEDFPLVTLWSNGDESEFICIEPWAGTTDFVENTGRVEEKYCINKLESKNKKEFIQKIKFI